MNIMKYLVRKLIKKMISISVRSNFFSNRFLDELISLHPHVIETYVREHGDKLVEALSDSQKMAALESLCKTHLLDVITLINSQNSGSFRYTDNEGIKIVVGSGGQKMEGWLATDIDQLNIVEDSAWRRLFSPGNIDRVLAEHVLEHLSLQEFDAALRNIYKYLKPGGIFRLAVPDAFHPSKYYYNLVKPGGWETPFEHKLFFDHELVSRIAGDVGFEVRLLEYFDENGIFHSTDYKNEDGVIQRCARHNVGLDTSNSEVMANFYSSIPEHLRQQFLDNKLTYTSLIVDLVKLT